VSQPDDYDDTGLHAFVFVEHVPEGDTPRGLIDRLRTLERRPEGAVLFASGAVGPYVVFAHVRIEGEDDLAGLQEFMNDRLWKAGVRCAYCVETDTYRDPVTGEAFGVMRTRSDVIAIVSIVVRRGHVPKVLERLGELPTFEGASVVTGQADILLQLGGKTLREIVEVGMDALQRVEGILHTSTAFTDGRR
jgi:DNA-binding Lrp family transcriptional regulator